MQHTNSCLIVKLMLRVCLSDQVPQPAELLSKGWCMYCRTHTEDIIQCTVSAYIVGSVKSCTIGPI